MPKHVTEATVLEHVRALPHARATYKQLVKEFRAHGEERGELEASLERVSDKGYLIELRSGHFIAIGSSPEYMAGRLSQHRDGYGFLIPDQRVEGIEGDVFLPPEEAAKAMHGDRAAFEPGDEVLVSEREPALSIRASPYTPTSTVTWRHYLSGCCDGRVILPRGLRTRSIREARVRVFVEINLAVQNAGLNHQIAHQIEIWFTRRQRGVHNTVQRLGERPAEQGWFLVVIEASDEICGVFAMRFALVQPQAGAGNAVD